MARKAIGKRLRFEIFKRDGFKCQYCGATPVQAALVVDHVVPVAEGGTNDPANLISACEPCNQGKGAVPLDASRLDPKRDPERLREQADQIREYLALKKDLSDAKRAVEDQLLAEWMRLCGDVPDELPVRLPRMLEEFGYEFVLKAFGIVARRTDLRTTVSQLRYLHGILRREREQKAHAEMMARLASERTKKVSL